MLLLALLLAQVTYPPADTSSVTATANTALSTAQAAQAAIPPACTAIPPRDTYTGTVGSLTPCTPPQDATRPTQVQSTSAVTIGDGTFSGTFTTAFASVPSYAHAEIYSSATPFVCQINTVTATTFSGKCFQVISTTLPGTLLALGGLVVSPIASVAAGQTVKVIARQ